MTSGSLSLLRVRQRRIARRHMCPRGRGEPEETHSVRTGSPPARIPSSSSSSISSSTPSNSMY